ncbi:MAG: hypothetical protein OEV20_03040 [Actinomycetota bacterium]|nr:hypothetical protein [Actinomycetota bacterium]
MSDEERQREEQERLRASAGADRADDGRPAGDDDAWLERFRDVYAPEPMSPAERRAFDARLEERIEVEARRGPLWLPIWQPVVAAAAIAALAVWLVWSPAPDTSPTVPTEVATARRPASLADWEREILAAADPATAPESAGSEEILPDDYRAIAGMFLGGGGGANAR